MSMPTRSSALLGAALALAPHGVAGLPSQAPERIAPTPGTATFDAEIAPVRKWKLLDGREVSEAKLGGVGGFVAAKKGVVEWFELGGVRHERIAATFAVATKGAHADERVDGNIGTELLRQYVLVTDYAGERVSIRPREAAPAAKER